MEFPINCSPAQIRKLKCGGAITLNRSHFVDGAPYRIVVMPNTARRINTAVRKDKGVRIALKPEEDLVAMTEGGKISLKSIGKKIKKAGKEVGSEISKGAKVVKKGFDKKIVDSGLGKRMASELIDIGTSVLLPTAGALGSMALGDPTGMSGAAAGQILGDQLDKYAERQGYGVFKSIKKYTGINKKDIVKTAKVAGKSAVRVGAKVAGEALTAYTGNPAVGMAFERVAVSAADRAIDSKKGKDILKNAGRGALKEGKLIAVEGVDDYIDKNLSGVEKDVAQKALAGKYPSAKDLIYDYGNSKIEEMNAFSGYGIPRRVRGGLRMGKGMAHLTPAYAVAMRSATTGAGFRVADDRVVTSAPTPSSIIQTGSPYQRINSAAMSPFIPSSPQLAGFRDMRSGGSFYPAGRVGGSFIPA